VHLAILREYYWSSLSRKPAKENELVSGENIIVLGRLWGSPGSHMADTRPLGMGEVG